MALIFNQNNEEIQKIIEKLDIEPPKYWVGDMVKLKPDWKDRFVKIMNKYHPTVNALGTLSDNIDDDFRINHSYKIHQKFLHDSSTPWWSLLVNDEGIKFYFFDVCFSNTRPSYTPKKFVYESFNDFKQIK